MMTNKGDRPMTPDTRARTPDMYVLRLTHAAAYWTARGLSPRLDDARRYASHRSALTALRRLGAAADFDIVAI